MRARGAKVTDIAVLVVAADDGVMPQTQRVDRPRARRRGADRRRGQQDRHGPTPTRRGCGSELVAEGLQPEEWGGTTQFSDVSAKEKQNLDDLLEKVLLVADVELELTANPNAEASGPIIESRLDVGRGPVATMLVQRGTLHVGDAIVAGDAWGKVRALHDYRGEKVQEARPGDPVEILGFDKPPPAGELGRVVENERAGARTSRQLRGQRLRAEQLAERASGRCPSEDMFTADAEGERPGPEPHHQGRRARLGRGASSASSQKIQHTEVRVNVIHSGVGGITENDVMLAVGVEGDRRRLQRPPERRGRARWPSARASTIRTYRVIYQLTEDIQQALVGMLEAESREDDGRRGRGAPAVPRLPARQRSPGCYVTNGTSCGAALRCASLRDGAVVSEASIAQLKRFKDDVREVAGRLRVRHPARELQRREGRRRARVLRDAPDRAHRPRQRRRPRRPSPGGRRGRRATSASSPVELHFPEAGSLKGKRKHVKSAEGAAPESIRRLRD